MIFVKHIFNFSNCCTDFDEIWLMYASKLGYSSLFKSSSNYDNELLGSYVKCIFTMYWGLFTIINIFNSVQKVRFPDPPPPECTT